MYNLLNTHDYKLEAPSLLNTREGCIFLLESLLLCAAAQQLQCLFLVTTATFSAQTYVKRCLMISQLTRHYFSPGIDVLVFMQAILVATC
jgi:hypothetical protein